MTIIQLREGKKLDINKRVKVYRNLNNNKLSVKQGKYVIGHCEEIMLEDVKFRVQKSGLERCRKEKRKNVHAYVSGYVSDQLAHSALKFNVEYDPYKYDSFVDEFEVPIYECKTLHVDNYGVMSAY